MLVLRLSRTGRRNQPKYRLVVTEDSSKIQGKATAVVGHYIPTGKKELVIDRTAVEMWLSRGVQPSDTVARLLNGEGFSLPVHQRPERKPKKAPAEAPVAPAAAPEATTADETPAAEAVAEEAVAEEAPAQETVEAPVEEVAPEATPEVAVEEAAPAEEPAEGGEAAA